jgi:nitrogen fixation/metabolism regulation signal transduction histidine kinase
MIFSFMLEIHYNIVVLIFVAILMLIEISDLISGVNRMSRKIALFFEAVQNEDTSLTYPENVKNQSLRKLHVSMNRINSFIADIKLRNETRERFYKELIENSATGLLIIDPDGYFEIVNKTALKYLNMSHISNLELLKQRNPALYDLFTTLHTGEMRRIRLENTTGTFQLSARVTLLKFGDRFYRLISIQDIKQEMEENEIEAWQKLTNVLTHEMMNSITPLTSMADTLIRFLRKDDRNLTPDMITQKSLSEILMGLEIIKERGKSLLVFVNDYRKFIRPPEPLVRKINISEFIQKSKILLKQEDKSEKNVIAFMSYDPPDFYEFDQEQILQVLLNLVNNASQAIKSIDNGMIEICFFSRNDKFCIDVSDNGPGIPDADLEKIFIPFYTTKHRGSGIGLSISRQIINRHNGKFTVLSEPYVRTTFTIEL